MSNQCKICGAYNCKKHASLIGRAIRVQQFAGSSPPEIFVGRWNYPNVYAGIVSPPEHGDTAEMSNHELWHQKKLPIPNILSLRSKLILARDQTNIHKAPLQEKFLNTMQEVAMTHHSIGAEYHLKKPISVNPEKENRVPLLSNAAPVQRVRLEENPAVRPKIDYLVSDTDVKAKTAMLELSKAGFESTSIIKLLSAGLLGLKKSRILVPTRWSITATDDTISKEKLKQIRLHPQISEILIFHGEYVGNHYEFLLLPENFSFEVIEVAQRYSPSGKPISMGAWHDHESFFARKTYADSVTGAYYANRLALCEYLERIKRQASCLVIREVRPEYSSPLGVGILRQISREAFSNQPEKAESLDSAFKLIQSRLRLPLSSWTEKSVILKSYKKQSRIQNWF